MSTQWSAQDRPYSSLLAWQRAVDLAVGTFEASEEWPPRAQFSLGDQIRRSALSISANIAEGKGRTGAREFLHFLSIAQGSRAEFETHLIIAHRLRYVDEQLYAAMQRQSDEIGRLISGLIRKYRPASAPRRTAKRHVLVRSSNE